MSNCLCFVRLKIGLAVSGLVIFRLIGYLFLHHFRFMILIFLYLEGKP